MFRMKSAMMAVVLAGVCGIAAPAFAHEGYDKNPKERAEALTKKLHLSDQQKTQVEQIMTEYHDRAQSLHEQLQAMHKEKHAKIRAVLTPEQQAAFDKMDEEKDEHAHDKKDNDHDKDDKH